MSMSGPTKQTSKPASKNVGRSQKDEAELAKLDATFERMRKSIPAAPYILSTPSDHAYRHWSRQEAHSFMIGHIFESHEEHLQYRTFLYREPYVDCFVTQSGEEEPHRPEKFPDLGTPTQAPKKKISLSAYKATKANGVITPGSKKVSPDIPATKVTQPQTNGVKTSGQPHSTAPKRTERPSSPKRSSENTATTNRVQKPVQDARKDGEPPLKKARRSPSPNAKRASDGSAASNATPHGLPPLLSPVRTTVLPNPYGLPPILSPTLPSNIQDELVRIETQRKRAESDASSSSDKKKQHLSVPEPKGQKREETAKSAVRTVGKTPDSSNAPSPAAKKPQAQSHHDDPKTNAHDREDRYVAKLRYGKKNRSRVQQLLKFQPKAVAAAEKKERQDDMRERMKAKVQKASEGTSAKERDREKPRTIIRDGDVSKPMPNADYSARAKPEKRGRTEEDGQTAPPPKRQKPQELDKNPSTPVQQSVSSPALSNKSSAQKSQSQYNTPRKELRALNMIRSNSNEGNDATPKAPTSVPSTGKKQVDVKAWSRSSMLLNHKGRALKHESQKIAEKGDKMTKEDRERIAVMGIECILAYMASFHATDIQLHLQGRAGEVENTWKTLLPLSMSYSMRTKDFPHLDGLRLYLSAVISACISGLVAQRSRQPKTAHDSPHDNASQNDPTMNLALLSDHVLKAMRCSHEARLALPQEEIETHYPRTWKRRETAIKPSKDVEKLPVGVLAGPYFLPLGIDTTPIQAVRFGLQFLAEWNEKQKLSYDLRVSLGKSD